MRPVPKRLRILITSYKTPLYRSVHWPRVAPRLIQPRGERRVRVGIEIRRDRASVSITCPSTQGRVMLAPFLKRECKSSPGCTIFLSLVRKDAKFLCFYWSFSSTKKKLTAMLD